MVAHARTFADKRNFLAVGQHHDVVTGQHAARGVDGPFHKRDPGQLPADQNNGILLMAGMTMQRSFTFLPFAVRKGNRRYTSPRSASAMPTHPGAEQVL